MDKMVSGWAMSLLYANQTEPAGAVASINVRKIPDTAITRGFPMHVKRNSRERAARSKRMSLYFKSFHDLLGFIVGGKVAFDPQSACNGVQ